MKKSLLSLALASATATVTTLGVAADANAADPGFSITGNIGVATDYRFRGVSQTNKKPAVQGGIDLAASNGLSLGIWTSNVSEWANPGGAQEVDVYGGYATEVEGVGVSVGAVSYMYPKNNPVGLLPSNKTLEYYVGLSYGPVSYKASIARGNWFGIEADGGVYHDLTASLGSLGMSDKYSFAIHVGKQMISESGAETGNDYGFTDYSVKANYAISDSLSAALTVSKVVYSNATDGESWFLDNGGGAVVLSITKTF